MSRKQGSFDSMKPVSPKQSGTARTEMSASAYQDYTAADIEVLEGLEPVRRRPGMYIGSTDERGLHHLFSEVIDNAMDEAVAGYANRIEIILSADGTVTVTDNGRGIPTDPHPGFKDKSALEVVMTTLHAGGKFGSRAYQTSGGLHGVGISVVNALSCSLIVEVARGQQLYRQSFTRGSPTSALEILGHVNNRRGTSIRFLPDPDIFGKEANFDPGRLFRVTRSKAYLFAGLEIRWSCVPERLPEKQDIPEKAVFCFPGGLKDFLTLELSGKTLVIDEIFTGKITNKTTSPSTVEWAVAWNEDEKDQFSNSYCNTIPTPEGGTHEAGFRTALLHGLKRYGELVGEKKIIQITSEDVMNSVAFMLSLFICEPAFQGQTKNKLSTQTASRIVEQAIRDPLDHWLAKNPMQTRLLLDHVIHFAGERIRRRKEKEVSRKSATRKLRLPGKLTDCSRQAANGTEIFIVEGDSAGGSAKMARDRHTQAILPLRGKILNVANASSEKLKENQQLADIILALGCGSGSRYFQNDLRYEKIIIMTDADVDGAHIASLLITFFFNSIPELIINGHLYLASPPLYRLTKDSKTIYARDEAQKNELLAGALKGHGKVEIGRFKGLGEMTARQLKETTMDPSRRTLLQIMMPRDEKEAIATSIDRIMGSRAESRLSFIQERAEFTDTRQLDIWET
ncbi:MAG: DNA topoisomerase IV subunit B [Alphaproteobacteria bacterium]|nr:DNA topoisomerase IV subunit B [Alphaproteobacteria bacterium]